MDKNKICKVLANIREELRLAKIHSNSSTIDGKIDSAMDMAYDLIKNINPKFKCERDCE